MVLVVTTQPPLLHICIYLLGFGFPQSFSVWSNWKTRLHQHPIISPFIPSLFVYLERLEKQDYTTTPRLDSFRFVLLLSQMDYFRGTTLLKPFLFFPDGKVVKTRL